MNDEKVIVMAAYGQTKLCKKNGIITAFLRAMTGHSDCAPQEHAPALAERLIYFDIFAPQEHEPAMARRLIYFDFFAPQEHEPIAGGQEWFA